MIEWIVTSSAMILLVLILRLVVKERVSPRLRYALWGLVLLRLLFPGTIFESKASVMTPVAAQEPYQAVERIPDYIRTQPDGRLEIGHSGGGNWTSIPKEVIQSRETVTYDWPPVEAELGALQKQVNIRNIFLFVWLGGSAAVGTFLFAANLKFRRNLKKNHRQTLEQYRGRWVFVVDRLPTPCLFGLLQPCIYLTPEIVEDETAKAHVLAHEYTHFRQWDHIWALLRGICLAVHWFNPLVWMAAVLSRRDCELSCDEGAVRLLGEQYRADYGRTLVSLVSRRTTAVDLARCATTMTGGRSALKERVALLVKRPRTTAVMAVIVAAACVGFAICTFTGAAEAEEPDETPVQSETEGKPQTLDAAANLPSLDELPTEAISAHTLGDLIENTDPYWLMDQLYEEDIALYAVNPMGTADKVQGIYLRYGEHLQYFDQVISPYIITRPQSFWYDFDGDGDNELLVVYSVEKAAAMMIDELVIYEWEGDQWSEHKYDPTGLMDDFNANAVFESDADMSQISYQGQEVQIALGGEECFISRSVATYTIYRKEGWGIELTLWGQIGPTLTSTNYAFDYICDIYYHANGTFTEGRGTFNSFYNSENPLPALEDLPTEFVTDSGYNDPIWLLAELPAEDIAVYYEQQSGGSLIRSSNHLQRVTQNLAGGTLPELYFQDLDGDGDKELMVFYNAGRGTGTYITKLVVYEWDAEAARWFDCGANLEENIIWDFNNNRTLTVYPEQGRAVVGYNGEELSVDLKKRFGDALQWSGQKMDCELQELYYNYSMESYGLTLTISGEIRPEGYPPTTCYAFDYICDIYYEDGGYFRSAWGYMDTDYLWSPKMDEGRLTDTFRNILHSFMRETLEIQGIEETDLVNDYFAICDVNGDGRDELITQRNNGPTAAHAEMVYDQYGNLLLFAYAGLVTYYSNGYATAGWSHNQGWAGDKLWPYTVYQYNAGTRAYEYVASVDGWNKALGETYQSFNPDNLGLLTFPDDVDKDGDGFVYYIITEEGGYAPAYGTPMDYAEWAVWADYLGGNVVAPLYVRLTEENIARIG